MEKVSLGAGSTAERAAGVSSAQNIKDAANKSIVAKVSDIASKSLRFFGIDTTFIAKFAVALAKTAIPALLVIGGIFAASYIMAPIALAAIIGVIFLVGTAIAAAKLSMMKDTVSSLKEQMAEATGLNQELANQTKELKEENAKQQKIIKESKESLNELSKSLASTAQNASDAIAKLAKAEESLNKAKASYEQLMQASDQKHQDEIGALAAELKAEIKAKETEIETQRKELETQGNYIDKCLTCFTGVFTSQDDLIKSLQNRLQKQSESLKDILGNIRAIANGEEKLTEALAWAQGKITEAQTEITKVVDSAAKLTDPSKVKELIESGEFTEKAKEIQTASQKAFDVMSTLNTDLNAKIIDAQKAITENRKQAEDKCKSLESQVAEAKREVECHSAELKKQKETIAKLTKEKEAKIAELNERGKADLARLKTDAIKQAQTFKAKTEKEKTELDNQIKLCAAAMQKTVDDLAESKAKLENTEANLAASQAKAEELKVANARLDEQLKTSQKTIEEHEKTIEEQKGKLAEANQTIANLEKQLTSSGGLFGSVTGGQLAAAALGAVGGAAAAVAGPALLATGATLGAVTGAVITSVNHFSKAQSEDKPTGTPSQDNPAESTSQTKEKPQETTGKTSGKKNGQRQGRRKR